MKNQANGIGDYSSSPTGQSCLWAAAVGLIGVLGFSYLSTYAGFTHDPLDRVDSGIAGLTRPTAVKRSAPIHAHRRVRRHRVATRSEE